ncbi:hypothetical protein AHF37_05206 [Paragonimus kellicotti]|nr:hypothetical protein AHF37_05206 [Paragonimus kellicotti]
MQVDSLSLGIVKSVSKFNVDVCLPHGEIGRVNIYDISDKYSELLKEMVASGQISNAVASLEDMFSVGQSVRCFIKKRASSLSNDRQYISGSKHLAEISLNPKLVNKDISKKYLRMRTIFTGAIQTEEDHGYTIDSGINGVQCFLPYEGLHKKFPLGSLVLVCPHVTDALNFVASGMSRILEVTTDFGAPSDVVLSDSVPVHFCCLLPGLWVRAVVFKRISSTIIAKFADHLITISRAHYNGSEEDYPLNMEVIVCLIVVDPGTKQIIGSLLPHLLPTAVSTENQPTLATVASIGTRLSDCPIERVDKRTLHLTVPGSSFRVVVRKGHVPTKLADDNLKSKFTIGKSLGRYIDHDLIENVRHLATMRSSFHVHLLKLLQLPFLSIGELSPGDKLTAVVNRFTKTGIVVRAEDRLNGLIPYLHLADMPLKRPAEKFTRGEKISCRVLSLDHSANKLLLTAKRGLVESACPLFGSKDMYDWLESRGAKETLFAAFVVKVSEQGLLLSGLQDLRAWLPRRETGLGPDDVLEATYFRGQVLRVRILHRLDRSRSSDCHTENENAARSEFLVSLKLKSTSEPSGKLQKLKFSSVQIGQVFQAKVTKVQQTGLIVDLHSTEATDSAPSPTVGSAFLGFDQLSDSETNQALFAQCMHNMKSGNWLDFDRAPRSVVVINKTANTLVVSARPTLIQSARVRQQQLQQQPTADTEPLDSNHVDEHVGFVGDFSDLRVGSQWFAWVLNHVAYGIFVQFPVGVRGLAPTRLLSDNVAPKHVNWKELFPSGATVIAKVVELAPSEKRRCLVSLRMMDTYFAEEHYVDLAIRSLNTWLMELDWIARKRTFVLRTKRSETFHRLTGSALSIRISQAPSYSSTRFHEDHPSSQTSICGSVCRNGQLYSLQHCCVVWALRFEKIRVDSSVVTFTYVFM